MSHAATNWAILQRGLKPSVKILLWHLADRHNKDTKRCDPSQELLAFDAEMSRATVNRHLDILEEKGLVRRVKRSCPKTRKQLSTHYMLSFDNVFPVSQIATRPVSQKDAIPCLNFDDSRVSNCDTNPVREPVSKPCASEAEPQTIFNLEIFASKFLDAFPRIGSKSKVVAALEKAVTGGADPDQILAGASAYATEQKGNEARYIAFAENWLEQKRWASLEKPSSEKVATRETVNIQRAQAIIEGRSWTIGSTSPDYARELVHLGLVTEAQCRATGVRL
ncbi:helix-turn-helix domain-containing protein [Falsihalocynthiibacter arcticus]|uniref:helix-turn-helix domain-containing protein n=1 Tax=Falsihalocynthiibacter arcticus TaxID=1579316 RepID=UPI0030013557